MRSGAQAGEMTLTPQESLRCCEQDHRARETILRKGRPVAEVSGAS